MWELCALFGEAPSILPERLSGLLLALAEVPQVAGADVGPLEVSLENSN